MKRFGWIVAATMAGALVASCNGATDTATSSQKSPTIASASSVVSPPATTSAGGGAPLMAAVNLGDFSAECKIVKCWLPTQFGPRLIERQSVSLEERTANDPKGAQEGWPMDGGPGDKGPEDGDKIQVLCIVQNTVDGQYLNTRGQLIYEWYRVVVPEAKTEPASKALAQRSPDGQGYLAYVGISWLYLPPGTQVSACSS